MERFLDTDLSEWEPDDKFKSIYCCDPGRNPVPVSDNIRFRQDTPLSECNLTDDCKCRVCRCRQCANRSGRGSATYRCGGAARKTTSNSPLRAFDAAMKSALNTKRFPRLDESATSAVEGGILNPILARTIRRGFPTERSLPPSSEAEMKMMSIARQFSEMDKVYRYEQTLRAAEKAAQMAPPERREEAALAGAKDYSINVTERRGVQEEPDCVIEVLSYMGVTRPVDDDELNERQC